MSNAEIINHSGVKGMKWGVRKVRKAGRKLKKTVAKKINETKKNMAANKVKRTAVKIKNAEAKKNAPPKPLPPSVNNKTRSFSRAKKYANMAKKPGKISEADLRDHIKRIGTENELRRISTSEFASKSTKKIAKKSYKKRGKMDNDTIDALKSRLQLEEAFGRVSSKAFTGEIPTIAMQAGKWAKDTTVSYAKQTAEKQFKSYTDAKVSAFKGVKTDPYRKG